MSSALSHLPQTVVKNNSINQDLFTQYEVKRGLRNANGSGVLAGLTVVSSVIGSKIIDSESIPVEGDLRYRGIPIKELVEKVKNDSHAFERVVYLLLVGTLPTAEEFKAFLELLHDQAALPQDVIDHAIKGLPSHNIMNKLMTSVSALYGYDEDADSIDPYQNFLKSVNLIAKLPAIIAYSYLQAFKKDCKFVPPKPGMSFAQSLLYMLHEGQEPSELEVKVLDICLVLHAEHGGGNNSTFAARVVSSSESDLYSTTIAAMASLKGPLHGAASIMARLMMVDIRDHLKNVTDKEETADYIQKILKKEVFDKSGKIYGLGHAVYTKSDPRASILMDFAKDLAKIKNREEELQLYFNVEELSPKLFNEFKGSTKVIAPNVDFFSGFVYDCLGIPSDLNTPLFAAARTAGWCAHRIEELISGKRIIRPSYKYVG